jgi:hypothetical protein
VGGVGLILGGMKLVTLNLEEKDMKPTTTTTILMIYTSLENMKDPESNSEAQI